MSEAELRFKKKYLKPLAEALHIPPGKQSKWIRRPLHTPNMSRYPCIFGDMVPHFGKPVPVLSMVTNTVIDYTYTINGHRITCWTDALLNPVALDAYAPSVHAKGAALQNCFGFVDETVRPIATPDEHQRMT